MGVMRAAITVGGFTLVSRVVGFLRECVMAFCLGAGIYTDALLVALRLANTFRRIFAEGAFNSSFLPRFSKILNNEGKESANVVFSDVFVALVLMLSALCSIVLVFYPSILSVILSGFDVLSEKFQITVVLGRICFPYILLISIASLFAGVLNSIEKFALPAALHSVLSLFTMSGMLLGYFLDFHQPDIVRLVAICVLLAGIMQSLILFASVKRNGFCITFQLQCWSDNVRDILRNMIPGIIGAGVWQLNLLVDTTISSYLPVGTITCMSLADRLNQFPLGTLGVALSTALLPILSKYIGCRNFKEAIKELERGLVLAFFLTLFATVFFMALSEPTVAVAFQRGLFGVDRVRITADALMGLSLGLPAYIVTKVFSAVYFACGDTKRPVIFGAISVFLNVIFLVVLVPFWKYFGLALCTSLSAVSNALMLMFFCDENIKNAIKSEVKFGIGSEARCFSKIFSQLCAAAITYVLLDWMKGVMWSADLGDSGTKWMVYAVLVGVACASYLGSLIVILAAVGQDWRLWKKEAWR